MRGGLSERERQLANSIQRYGFAAAIEVTNNLTEAKRENRKTHETITIDVYGAKAGQANVARSYLEALVGDYARINAGLAYNGDPVDPFEKDCLDFIIDINGYDPCRLEDVANEMLQSRYMRGGNFTETHRRLVRKILDNYSEEMPLTRFFSYKDRIECAELIGEAPDKYQCLLSTIKGLCMELYIKSLFSEEIEDRVIYHRFNFEYQENGKAEKKSHEADGIIACREDDFYSALERISRKGQFETWVKRWVAL